MNKEKAIKLFSELITKIYESENLTNELLLEIKKDLKKIDDLIPRKQYYRELVIFLDKAKKENDLNLRNNYKFLFLSGLEKRLEILKILE